MKPSTSSNKISTPSSLPAPLLMAEGITDSHSLQPALYKLAAKSYEYEEVSCCPSIERASIYRGKHLSSIEDTKELLYREQASSAKPSAAYARPKSKPASSSFANSTVDSAASDLSSTDNSSGALTLFMKSVLGEKTFSSINLLSVSFFVSGILLMFYLMHLI